MSFLKNKIQLLLNNNWLLLAMLLLVGFLIRLHFYFGHIFSDDAYYSNLSLLILNGDFAGNYQGYPIFLLRILFVSINSFFMMLFGVNETSTIILPFFISQLNIFLAYFFAKEIFQDKIIALLSAFLICFFPVEIVFASINFPDSTNVFLLNSGLFLLYRSYKRNNIALSILAGILFSASMLVKENLLYFLMTLLIIFCYKLLKQKQFIKPILIAFLVVVLYLFTEGLIYSFTIGDIYYRLSILSLNYSYSFYDFFPYSIESLTNSDNYLLNLFAQIILNLKHIFLRRFYLFVPLVAFIISVISIYKKRNTTVSVWFLLIGFLLIAFTTSPTEYKPLNLERSWYVFPLILPAVLLVSSELVKLKMKLLIPVLIIYLLGSLIMSNAYLIYFNAEPKSELKEYLLFNKSQKIYTDHFTQCSVDLIRGNDHLSESITNKVIGKKILGKNSILLYNKKHIDELKLQGYNFPGLESSLLNELKIEKSFGDFIIFSNRNYSNYSK